MLTPSKILAELIARGYEDEVVEFKTASNSYDFEKIGRYFSALSNEANLKCKKSAWLIFGVRDKDKEVTGTQFRNGVEALNKLKKEVADQINGRITFVDIHEVEIAKKRVLLFEIPPAPQGIPISWKGFWYGRDGESLVALNIEKLDRIRNQIKPDWSAAIISEASIDNLDPSAIELARKNYKIKNPKLANEVDSWTSRVFLNKAKITIEDKVTRTAILLLGLPDSEHYLSPANSRVSWILKDRDGIEKDYEHFGCPLIGSVDAIMKKIRNLKFRYLPEGTLFPEEIDQYDPYVIREAINNCLAHQDYTQNGRISIIEYEDGKIFFHNNGSFIPGTIENVLAKDAPESHYRNDFLANAMINLGMIDAIGSGIKRMFKIQQKRFFPLPYYDLSDSKVLLRIDGKILDKKFATLLARNKQISIIDLVNLDRISRRENVSEDGTKRLRDKKLIEGRKGNYHISANVAGQIGEERRYMKMRGIDDAYCREMIIQFLSQFESGKRSDFESFLLEKLPDSLSIEQKKNKVKNNLQRLKKEGIIGLVGKKWSLR